MLYQAAANNANRYTGAFLPPLYEIGWDISSPQDMATDLDISNSYPHEWDQLSVILFPDIMEMDKDGGCHTDHTALMACP